MLVCAYVCCINLQFEMQATEYDIVEMIAEANTKYGRPDYIQCKEGKDNICVASRRSNRAAMFLSCFCLAKEIHFIDMLILN